MTMLLITMMTPWEVGRPTGWRRLLCRLCHLCHSPDHEDDVDDGDNDDDGDDGDKDDDDGDDDVGRRPLLTSTSRLIGPTWLKM